MIGASSAIGRRDQSLSMIANVHPATPESGFWLRALGFPMIARYCREGLTLGASKAGIKIIQSFKDRRRIALAEATMASARFTVLFPGTTAVAHPGMRYRRSTSIR